MPLYFHEYRPKVDYSRLYFHEPQEQSLGTVGITSCISNNSQI